MRRFACKTGTHKTEVVLKTQHPSRKANYKRLLEWHTRFKIRDSRSRDDNAIIDKVIGPSQSILKRVAKQMAGTASGKERKRVPEVHRRNKEKSV